MNKSELIDRISEQVGGKAAASKAVEAVLETIMGAVSKGEKVALIGFGTFERRVRNARTARNIRTGELIKVAKANVPAFKAGAGFKELVGGARKAAGAASKAARGGAKAPAKKAAAKKAPAKKSAAKKAPAKKAAAKKAPAKKR